MRFYHGRLLAFIIALFWSAGTAVSAPRAPVPATPSSASQSVANLTRDLENLQIAVSANTNDIARHQGAIDGIMQHASGGGNTLAYAAFGTIVAALITGLSVFFTQMRQAANERMLKAIELIINSRSAHEAALRADMLEFLDPKRMKHLKDSAGKLSSPQSAEVHIGLAQAMGAKAATPAEVLTAWKTALQGWNYFSNIAYTGGSENPGQGKDPKRDT